MDKNSLIQLGYGPKEDWDKIGKEIIESLEIKEASLRNLEATGYIPNYLTPTCL
jgi:hypothetical protein